MKATTIARGFVLIGCLALASPATTAPRSRKVKSAPSPGSLEAFEARGGRAEILFLGVFHFEDPGLDTYKPRFKIDITSPGRQRELDRLIDQLARFQPTKVAVEVRRSEQPRLDSLFMAYVRGADSLGPNEVFQIGFRLAKRLRLPSVDGVDVESWACMSDDEARAKIASLGLSMDSLMRRIQEDPWTSQYQQLYQMEDSAKTVMTIAQHLVYLNDPQRIRVGHGAYLIGSFKFGPEAAYLGPDDATAWYNRNLRIFSNLQSITSDATDRILVIIGAGHLPILRFLAESSPEYRLRDVAEFVVDP